MTGSERQVSERYTETEIEWRNVENVDRLSPFPIQIQIQFSALFRILTSSDCIKGSLLPHVVVVVSDVSVVL